MNDFFSECAAAGIRILREGFDEYLRDESRLQGNACGLIRARSEADVVQALRLANRWSMPLTFVAGKTSLTGGSVPLGGIVVDLKSLDAVDPADPSIVGPGVIVHAYRELVERLGLFYPPDPTSERSCTVGGNVACNASGALSYLYGPTRDHIRGFTVVLPTGTVLDINRGDVVSRDGIFQVPRRLMTPRPQEDFLIPVPKTRAPLWHECKNAVGFHSTDPMDLVDLFVGSEGILGVFVEIRTVLRPKRNPFFGLLIYLPTFETAVRLVTLVDGLKRLFHDGRLDVKPEIEVILNALSMRGRSAAPEDFSRVVPSCMEWFHRSSAPLLSDPRGRRLERHYGAVYIEQEYPEGEGPEEAASPWADLIELFNLSLEDQSPLIETEAALDSKQIRSLRLERQGIPEKLNEAIRPGLVKIGTDFSVPMKHLRELMEWYEEELPRGKSFIFGHIGNAHIHSNLLAENDIEAERFREVVRQIAQRVCDLGGSVSGEHGIGKLKHKQLEMMLGAQGIDEIRKVKKLLDPKGVLNKNDVVQTP